MFIDYGNCVRTQLMSALISYTVLGAAAWSGIRKETSKEATTTLRLRLILTLAPKGVDLLLLVIEPILVVHQ